MNSDRVTFDDPQRVHIVAIGGAAMSGIARYLRSCGHAVSGSDVRESSTTVALQREGFDVCIGHAAHNVPNDASIVVYSTAVRNDNPELIAARERGIAIAHRSELMEWIARTRPQVAVVSGTHGKTSTTSMLSCILDAAGLRPSFFIGGTPAGLATNARFDPEGLWLAIEGDESDRSFLAFRRDLALITNIEADHLEHWDNSFASLVGGFAEFADGATTGVAMCIDDATVAELVDRMRTNGADRPRIVTYGFSEAADYRMTRYESTNDGTEVTMSHRAHGDATVRLTTRGRDMATNALGAATLANLVGVVWSTAVQGLGSYQGVARRFQYRSTLNGADCYDDYAHTATEIATTLARAREGAWGRVIAVCQPHRYTRIARHAPEYGSAFSDADHVVVAPLDPAFEPPIEGVSARLVFDAIRATAPETSVELLEDWDGLLDVPWRIGRAGDVIITLGCGTITEVHAAWIAHAERLDQS